MMQLWRPLPAAPERGSVLVAAMVWGGLLLPLVGGGDHFSSFRFFQPFELLIGKVVAIGPYRLWVEGPQEALSLEFSP